MKRLRILIADDHEVVRQGARALIEREPGWEICAVAQDGRQAVELARELEPDVVVMDAGMPLLNGLEATRQIRHTCKQTEVVIFSGEENDAFVQRVFEAGARSLITKTEAADQLVAAIRAVSEHKSYFTPQVSRVVFARFERPRKEGESPAERRQRLTPRERELTQLLAEGRSNKEAAELLGISIRTVETHRAALLRKLGLTSLAELVRYAVKNGLIKA